MRSIMIVLAVLAVAGALGFGLLTRPVPLKALTVSGHTPDLENGRTMFYAGGCTSCHAAPGAKGDDKLVLAGGLELDTPFGRFVVPNISPDPDAGIGSWSDLDFVNAMVKGLSPDGQHYYPAFPYVSYSHVTEADLIDMKAFIFTLPVSANEADAHDLKFPFSFRRGIGLWKLLYLGKPGFHPTEGATEEFNRGKYLVEGAGHCGECHTPRDAFGGLDLKRWMAGAPLLEGKGSVPNITPHADGLKSWSPADVAYYLETGFTPDYDSVGGSMVSVQENMAQLPASDRAAIADYLAKIPAVAKPAAP